MSAYCCYLCCGSALVGREVAAAPRSDGEVSRGALYTRGVPVAHTLEDGGGKSLRHREEGGRTAGGSDMKGSSGRTG